MERNYSHFLTGFRTGNDRPIRRVKDRRSEEFWGLNGVCAEFAFKEEDKKMKSFPGDITSAIGDITSAIIYALGKGESDLHYKRGVTALLDRCNDDGEFGLDGIVVHYWANKYDLNACQSKGMVSAVLYAHECGEKFENFVDTRVMSFQDYIALGKPRRLKITTVQNISPADYSFKIRIAKEDDLQAIAALQQANIRVSNADKKEQGFVSVETNTQLLSQINKDIGILVAEANDKIVGYEVPLALKHATQIPLLDPFVKRFTQLEYDRRKIEDYRWIIEGQICVDRNYKSRGIAEALHKKFVATIKEKEYELIVTEISDQNPRSLHVHKEKLGLQVLDTYQAEGRNWHILVQDVK